MSEFDFFPGVAYGVREDVHPEHHSTGCGVWECHSEQTGRRRAGFVGWETHELRCGAGEVQGRGEGMGQD